MNGKFNGLYVDLLHIRYQQQRRRKRRHNIEKCAQNLLFQAVVAEIVHLAEIAIQAQVVYTVFVKK